MDLTNFSRTVVATSNTNHTKKSSVNMTFLNAKMTGDWTSHGVGNDLVYRDPWGNYMISLDPDYDNKTRDGFYCYAAVSAGSGLTQNPVGGDTYEASTPVMVWSLGPDGNATNNVAWNQGVNKDNITTW